MGIEDGPFGKSNKKNNGKDENKKAWDHFGKIAKEYLEGEEERIKKTIEAKNNPQTSSPSINPEKNIPNWAKQDNKEIPNEKIDEENTKPENSIPDWAKLTSK